MTVDQLFVMKYADSAEWKCREHFLFSMSPSLLCLFSSNSHYRLTTAATTYSFSSVDLYSASLWVIQISATTDTLYDRKCVKRCVKCIPLKSKTLSQYIKKSLLVQYERRGQDNLAANPNKYSSILTCSRDLANFLHFVYTVWQSVAFFCWSKLSCFS